MSERVKDQHWNMALQHWMALNSLLGSIALAPSAFCSKCRRHWRTQRNQGLKWSYPGNAYENVNDGDKSGSNAIHGLHQSLTLWDREKVNPHQQSQARGGCNGPQVSQKENMGSRACENATLSLPWSPLPLLNSSVVWTVPALPRAQISLTPQKPDLARTAEKQGEFV